MFEAQWNQVATWATKNAPQLLFAGGITSGFASTVVACRATLKAGKIIDEAEKHKIEIEHAKQAAKNSEGAVSYTDKDVARDHLVLYIQTVAKFGKLYAPAIVLGGAAVFLLTKSQNIVQQRNAGLAAALTATTTAFNEYRGRVREEYGVEKDLELRHGKVMVEEPIIDKNGKDTGRTKQVAKHSGHPSMYAKCFDETNPNWSRNSPETNAFFLKCAQNWLNDQLQGKGHLFLNEVYDQIGMERTPAGAVVGWIRGEGDDRVDFGMWRDENMDSMYEFMTGNGGIWLDFNVQGEIYHRLDEIQQGKRHPKLALGRARDL